MHAQAGGPVGLEGEEAPVPGKGGDVLQMVMVEAIALLLRVLRACPGREAGGTLCGTAPADPLLASTTRCAVASGSSAASHALVCAGVLDAERHMLIIQDCTSALLLSLLQGYLGAGLV